MKRFNLSIGLFSFLFSLSIVIIFGIISFFYLQESIENIKSHEEHLIGCYSNKVTNQIDNVKEFKELVFGTLESFTYKIAIIDKNNKLLYTTFKRNPNHYNMAEITYYKDGSVFYNNTKYFNDIGEVKVILKKELDFSSIKQKTIIIISFCLIFLVICSLFLYLRIRDIYANITKQLDAFFKDAIHEIRTPLGVIQINLDFLENSMESSMPLKRAQGGLRNLTSVYESLEYCIKNKKIKYKKTNLDLSYFIENRIDFFKVLAEIKNININTSIEKNINVYMSRIELQRLIDNNISNAIKYSKENSQIFIKLFMKDSSIYISFSNFGEQIKNTNKIFQRYYRGDDIRGGFGLGLNIVEHICRIYNIYVEVTSNENGYTTFLYKIQNKHNIKDIK